MILLALLAGPRVRMLGADRLPTRHGEQVLAGADGMRGCQGDTFARGIDAFPGIDGLFRPGCARSRCP